MPLHLGFSSDTPAGYIPREHIIIIIIIIIIDQNDASRFISQ